MKATVRTRRTISKEAPVGEESFRLILFWLLRNYGYDEGSVVRGPTAPQVTGHPYERKR
jgi:hypothetical protein